MQKSNGKSVAFFGDKRILSQPLFWRQENFVPASTFDNYREAGALRFRLEKHLKLAGCPRLSFHAFRHTHASLLLNAGLPYKEIQTRLGHSKISMTMDIYSHLSKDNKKKATSFYEKAIENLQSS